jgi:hypothetical protein
MFRDITERTCGLTPSIAQRSFKKLEKVRKNNHPQAGWHSAVIYSMLISARRRGLNPGQYLTDILGRLPSTKIAKSINCFLVGGRPHRRTPLEAGSSRFDVHPFAR